MGGRRIVSEERTKGTKFTNEGTKDNEDERKSIHPGGSTRDRCSRRASRGESGGRAEIASSTHMATSCLRSPLVHLAQRPPTAGVASSDPPSPPAAALLRSGRARIHDPPNTFLHHRYIEVQKEAHRTAG